MSQVPLGVPRQSRVKVQNSRNSNIPHYHPYHAHRDRVYHERKELAEIFKNGAKVYLCGSGRMASGVKEMCARIYADYKEVELEEGREWMKAVQAERFATDIFG